MDEKKWTSHPLRLDPDAKSTRRGDPAFIARPWGAPAYHGFPLVPDTETDGWVYGAITEFEDENGCMVGDGYVVAPDGSRAGLVWDVNYDGFDEVCRPTHGRWGVYAVGFERPVRTVEDLVYNFRRVLPLLKAKHHELSERRKRNPFRRLLSLFRTRRNERV